MDTKRECMCKRSNRSDSVGSVRRTQHTESVSELSGNTRLWLTFPGALLIILGHLCASTGSESHDRPATHRKSHLDQTRRDLAEVSVIVPVYRSAATLPELVGRLTRIFREAGRSFEVVLVEDDGGDSTWEVVGDLCLTYPEVRGIQLMRNVGQHNAILCGLRHCTGDLIVTMDDDLQNSPEDVPALVALLNERTDLVYGIPRRRAQSLYRRLCGRVVNLAYQWTFGLDNDISSFRAMSRRIAEGATAYSRQFTFLDGLFAWQTRRIVTIEVEHHPRTGGTSGYSLGKLGQLAMNLAVNFSMRPLQFATLSGMAFSSIGVILAASTVYWKLMCGVPVLGWSSLMVVTCLGFGQTLFVLGLLGEYTGRLHISSNQQPQYAIRSIVEPPVERVQSVTELVPKANKELLHTDVLDLRGS
jgi:glycosyltransferase involved in cell wall biosynthesis